MPNQFRQAALFIRGFPDCEPENRVKPQIAWGKSKMDSKFLRNQVRIFPPPP